jgi:exonuclease III
MCVWTSGNSRKNCILQELREVRGACSGPWVIVGDFNLIYNDEDKSNLNYNRAMMGRFMRFINDQALKVIPLHGRHFTWSNQHAASTLVKLDGVLDMVGWEEQFPDCLLQSMASNDSDHCPLLLGLKDNFSGVHQFHFEAF